MSHFNLLARVTLALLAAGGLPACDGFGRSAPTGSSGDRYESGTIEGGQKTSELVVRIDAPSGGFPSASLVAFKARVIGIDADQVAGAVDPLMVAGPDTNCALRQVDETIRLLRDARGAVELEGLSRFQIELGPTSALRPIPRVFPDLASVVTGVVAEAGPEDLVELPRVLTLKPESGGDVVLQLPTLPQVQVQGGTLVHSGAKFSARMDLHLNVVADKGSYVELRPFGATTWAACPVGPEGQVTIPSDLLNKLVNAASSIPVSLDVVWRNRRSVQIAGESVRLSLETRATSLIEVSK
jgi:hypothetical protein